MVVAVAAAVVVVGVCNFSVGGQWSTSSFLVTALRAAGSRFDAARTSLNCASFFSNMSANAPSFFSSNRFLKLLFC